MTDPSNFTCIRCGNSCRLRVKVMPEDMKRVQDAPYVKEQAMTFEEIFEPDDFDPSTGDHALAMKEGACIFLGHDGSRYFCKIHPHRPKICRDYPFINGQVMACSALQRQNL